MTCIEVYNEIFLIKHSHIHTFILPTFQVVINISQVNETFSRGQQIAIECVLQKTVQRAVSNRQYSRSYCVIIKSKPHVTL